VIFVYFVFHHSSSSRLFSFAASAFAKASADKSREFFLSRRFRGM